MCQHLPYMHLFADIYPVHIDAFTNSDGVTSRKKVTELKLNDNHTQKLYGD